MKTNRMTKFNVVAVLLLIVSLFAPVAAHTATLIVAYGQAVTITPIYGSTGQINNIQIIMENSDMTGHFTYVCRRPNLAPCLSATLGLNYQFQANMALFCNVPGKVCGEGTITALTLLP